MRDLFKFGFLLLIFSLFVYGVFYFFSPALPVKFRYESWWKLQLFFTVITFIFHFGLLMSAGRRPQSITLYYMAGTTLKLLLFAGIIIAYTMLHRESAKGFIIAFFILYVFYTIFEVGVLYKKFSSEKGRNII